MVRSPGRAPPRDGPGRAAVGHGRARGRDGLVVARRRRPPRSAARRSAPRSSCTSCATAARTSSTSSSASSRDDGQAAAEPYLAEPGRPTDGGRAVTAPRPQRAAEDPLDPDVVGRSALGALAFVALNVVSQVYAPATEGVAAARRPPGRAQRLGQRRQRRRRLRPGPRHPRHDHGVPAPDDLLDVPRHAAARAGRDRQAGRARRSSVVGIGLACCALTAALAVPLLASRDAAPARHARRSSPSWPAPGRDAPLRRPGRRRGRADPQPGRRDPRRARSGSSWSRRCSSPSSRRSGGGCPAVRPTALLQASTFDDDLLAPWAGGLLLLAYALVFAARARTTAPRRHLTAVASVQRRTSAIRGRIGSSARDGAPPDEH